MLRKFMLIAGTSTTVLAVGASVAVGALPTNSGSVRISRTGATFSGSYQFYAVNVNRGGFGYPGSICDTKSDGDSAYVEAKTEGYDWGGRVETSKGNGTCVSENKYVYSPDDLYVPDGQIHACVDISFYPDPCNVSPDYKRR